MPLSSTQISQLNGSFQAQYLQQQQIASLIRPPDFNLGGYNTAAQNEGMAGKAMNTAAAVAAPMATLGMGLLGVDPLSMGIKYGMSAGAAGGAGVGMAAGIAVGGGLLAGTAAVGYMGEQVMRGAQQSQQFNQNMRSSFAFSNPYGHHGRGFSEGDIHQIGGTMRGMAGGQIGGQFGGTMDQFQLGPSFAELGRLAANMGRMGLADGVRNAKEFTDKFKEMMKSVKTIAEDMGSTLEEAQKTMASMKGSGIFKNQSGVSHAIRAATVGGGLATTEVTGMMNIGSQISRMFGGTGKQGAMGGIKAIENVGAAIQTGVLSEEDIYQATGLTGAEGRQAMAQQGLLQTGSFLKSSRGRRLVAALADRNGQLDPNAVSEFASGGFSIGRTMQLDERMKSRVGRANFTRNEGRLRGAVMEQFGDMAPALAMMSWAKDKGIDIDSMGDREMLFMQRQMGLGRDDADALVKRARAMPQLLEHLREAKAEDKFSVERGMREQNSGIEGIKRKLEAARDKVNNSMQAVGQGILEDVTSSIAEWGNKLAGVYEEREIDVRGLKKSISLGGVAGKHAMKMLTGAGLGPIIGGGSGPSGIEGPHEDIGQRKYVDKMQEFQFATRMADSRSLSDENRSLIESRKSKLLDVYSKGTAFAEGEDRLYQLRQAFKDDLAMSVSLHQGTRKDQLIKIQEMESQLGIPPERRISESFNIPKLPELVGGGSVHTEDQRKEIEGHALLGTKTSAKGPNTMTFGAFGASAPAVASFDRQIKNPRAREAAKYFETEEVQALAFDALTQTKGASDKISMQMMSVDKGSAQYEVLQTIKDAGAVGKAIAAKGGEFEMGDADWAALTKSTGKSKETLTAQYSTVRGYAAEHWKAARTKIAEQISRTSHEEGEFLQAGGIANYANGVFSLTKDTEASLSKHGGKGAVQAARLAMVAQSAANHIGPEGEGLAAVESANSDFMKAVSGLTTTQTRAVAGKLAGTQQGGRLSEAVMRGTSIDASKGKKGIGGAFAGAMGLDLSQEEMASLKGANAEQASKMIAAKLGLSGDDSLVSGLMGAMKAGSKKGGGAAGSLLLSQTLQNDPAAQKKLEELAKGKGGPEEKIVDKITEGNNFLKALVQGNDKSVAALNAINNKTEKPADGEKK